MFVAAIITAAAAMVGVTTIGLYCCCKISGECSREEEKEKDRE